MPLIPLDIPPGIYRNGTELQSSNRWRDSNLVRWVDGTMRPIGGWRIRSNTASDAKVRGLLTWVANDQSRYIVGGTYNKLYSWTSAGVRHDITPTGLIAGRESAESFTGYGGSFYGNYAYGVARPDTARTQPATTWTLDNWGEYLLACSPDDGKIYEWRLSNSTPAAVVANAPINNEAIVVTEERFVFALGAGGNQRKIQFSDREDNTTWTPAATNEAGDIELNTSGRIMAGVRVQGQTLILTSTDAHVANYIGAPYVYGIERVGSSCGLIASKAYASVDQGAFWMGNHSFYAYAGGVAQQLESEVSDYVFSDINRAQISKAFAVSNSTYGEIFWFYPSGSSTENDRYVVYNYVEGTWYIGELGRTAGADMGTFKQPFWVSADDNKLYEHEIGFNYDSLSPFAESGSISLGAGDNVMSVTEMIPDEKTQGDVTVTFKARFYPNDTERSYGAFAMSNPTSLRFTGRQIRLRVDGNTLGDWRVGINRLNITPGGGR